MFSYGNFLNSAIILLLGLIITAIPQIQTAIIEQVIPNQKYDYIDVAKETFSPRSKGRTTRIFTTEQDLDEKFWLKYLGEEYNNAVHLEVDRNNNIIPVEKNKSQANMPKVTHEKRTRFIRQPTSPGKKHIPVKSQYPTEKPEIFNDKQISKPTNHNTTSHKHYSTKNKTLNTKNKLLLHNKHKQKIIKVKPSTPLKAVHEPIVINLPETESIEHQINDEQRPVIVQMPPVIYYQKADLYTRQNLNLPLNRRQHLHKRPPIHIQTQTQTHINSNLPPTLKDEQNFSSEFNTQAEIHQVLSLPHKELSDLPLTSHEIPSTS